MVSLPIVRKAQLGDPAAIEQIFIDYKNLFRFLSKKYFINGGDSDDVFQEASFGLLKAIKYYNEDYNSTFTSFASLCIKRHLISKFNHYNNNKHKSLNLATNFTAVNFDTWDSSYETKVSNYTPEDILIAKEKISEIQNIYETILTPLEKSVLAEMLKGFNYIEIANNLKLKAKSADNAIQRIKQKIKSYNN